jgi:flagellar protein FlgJ
MTTPSPIPSSVDLQGLTDLRHRAAREDPGALAEAAVQFEALFIGLMLKTARDASLSGGIFDGQESRQYLELMDQQVALELAKSGGFGLGKMIVEQLGARSGATPEGDSLEPAPATVAPRGLEHFPARLPPSLRQPASAVAPAAAAASGAANTGDSPAAGVGSAPESFVARFLDDATDAARKLGIEPRLLLAQAALETGWGAAAPQHPDGQPTNNLFGIKAGASWAGARSAQWTLEHSAGGAERKREEFRAYPTSNASFADYVDLISGSPRYAGALEQGADPEAYVRAVTAAGYATDPSYGDKWLSIYRGERLNRAVQDLKPGPDEPTQ